MKEIYCMWKYNTMVALTVLCAGIYMLFLLPFKSIEITPGFSVIRPATLFPVLFGLLFGPAGAWGSALGYLAEEMLRPFNAGVVFGFIGNFLYAYIPYRLWRIQKLKYGEDHLPTINSARKLIIFGKVSVIASISCAVVMAWGYDALNMVPFAALSSVITLNNAVVTLLLGPIILPVIYRPVKKAGLLWTDIMYQRDISKPGSRRSGLLMVYVGSAGGLAIGFAVSLLLAGQVLTGTGMSTEGAGSLYTGIGVLPFLAVLLYGALNS